MKKVLLVTLLGASALQAMEAEVLPQTLPLSKEDMWLVHQTRIFPKNGRMIAGGLMRIDAGESTFMKLTSDKWLALAKNTIAAWRNSIHWTLNSPVYPHKAKIVPRGMLDRTDSFYVILEPLRAFSGKKLCGYWQDVWHIGGHQLSPDAIILVPEGDTSYQELIGEFKGTVRTYAMPLCEAVNEALTERGAPILYPCMEGLVKKSHEFYHHHQKQAIMLKGTPYTSTVLSNCAELDDTVHTETVLGRVQRLFLETINPIRYAQGANFHLTHFIAGANTCLTCNKTAQQLASKKLLCCSRCKTARYCSADCQRANWPVHKKLCAVVPSCTDSMRQGHKEYLNYLYHLSLPNIYVEGMRFEPLINQLTQDLDTLIQSYPAREQLLLTHFKAYVTGMVHDLYNPKAQYALLREQYQVNTFEGFLAFARMIQEKYAPLAAEFDGSK